MADQFIKDESGHLLFSIAYDFKKEKVTHAWEFNTSCPLHIHTDYYELLFVISGTYQNVYNGVTDNIPENTLLVMNAGLMHEFNSTSDKDVHYVLCAEKTSFEQFISLHFPDVDLFEDGPIIKYRFSAEEAAYLERIARLTDHINLESKYMTLFLYNVIAHISLHTNTTYSATDEYVFDIIENINNTTYMNTPVDEIYARYPISSTTLLQVFEERTGISVKKYQIKRKMSYAASLLTSTNKRITEIAGEVGFDSFSHFLHLFKKTHSMTPKEYRNKYKDNPKKLVGNLQTTKSDES